jgi:hypothetical protein
MAAWQQRCYLDGIARGQRRRGAPVLSSDRLEGDPPMVRGVSQANGWLRRKSVLIVAAAALMTYEALR